MKYINNFNAYCADKFFFTLKDLCNNMQKFEKYNTVSTIIVKS